MLVQDVYLFINSVIRNGVGEEEDFPGNTETPLAMALQCGWPFMFSKNKYFTINDTSLSS